MFKYLVVFFSALLLSLPAVAQNNFYEPVVRPLNSRYRVHRTEHFEIIFEQNSEIEAWQTAQVLERTLSDTQSLSGEARRMWMPVILNNSSDQSNGYVHTHPFRQEIEVPHIKGSRLGARHHSWVEIVAKHELVHAAQAQAGGGWGLGELLHWFAPDFARILNLSLPSGLNEGAAVYFESTGTHQPGRLNDARFQMQYRAMAASEHPWSLSQMMERPQYDFHANRHYIGGAKIFAWQSSRDQGAFFRKMRSWRYRNPLRSTGLDFRKAIGQSLDSLVVEFRQETRPQTPKRQQIRQIIAGKKGVMQRWPQWLNDSTLVVYRKGLNETSGLYSIDLASGTTQLIHSVRLPEDGWFRIQNGIILYSRYVPDRFSTLASYADIFQYDISAHRETRITQGARVHVPVQTPSGISALQNDGQRNIWVEIKPDGRIQKIRGRSQADLIQLAPSKEIYALLVRHGGWQGIYKAQLDGELKPWIFLDHGTIRELSWSSDGQYLFFTADIDGVTNVYGHNLSTERTIQLTDVLYGAMDPMLSKDQRTLVYVDYQHQRYDLVSAEFSPDVGMEVSLLPVQELPRILSRPELPDNFTHEPYRLASRLRPRMVLPFISRPNGYPEKELGMRTGLRIYGSDPLRQITYMMGVMIQSERLGGHAEVSSVLGPVMVTLNIYNEAGALAEQITAQKGLIQAYGEESAGIGVTAMLPLRFEANVRNSFARITTSVRSQRTRWFSLDGSSVPIREDTGESFSEWEHSTSIRAGVLLAIGLQQNTRDLWPNRGSVVGVYGQTDVLRENDSGWTGLYLRYRQYWSFLRRSNTGMVLGVDLLTQNNSGVYSNSLVIPQGHKVFLGRGVYARVKAEALQPVWYVDDGLLTIPVYLKAVYVYGFAERMLIDKESRGIWAAGVGLGIQFRLLHYLDMEIRASVNPLDFRKHYIALM